MKCNLGCSDQASQDHVINNENRTPIVQKCQDFRLSDLISAAVGAKVKHGQLVILGLQNETERE